MDPYNTDSGAAVAPGNEDLSDRERSRSRSRSRATRLPEPAFAPRGKNNGGRATTMTVLDQMTDLATQLASSNASAMSHVSRLADKAIAIAESAGLDKAANGAFMEKISQMNTEATVEFLDDLGSTPGVTAYTAAGVATQDPSILNTIDISEFAGTSDARLPTAKAWGIASKIYLKTKKKK